MIKKSFFKLLSWKKEVVLYSSQYSMYARYNNDSKIYVLALDVRKDFGQVEWKYSLSVIREFCLGENFAFWVEMLYAHPTVSVITNHNKSRTFSLHRSCRQGCPLSPRLFAIAIEHLAISVRNHPSFCSFIVRQSWPPYFFICGWHNTLSLKTWRIGSYSPWT